jgi:hypothetical protein
LIQLLRRVYRNGDTTVLDENREYDVGIEILGDMRSDRLNQ